MSKFKVGDHVEVLDDFDTSFFKKGSGGTVVELGSDDLVRVNFTYGDFDTILNAKIGGLWVLEYKLKLVKPYSASFTQQTSGVGFGDFLVEGHTTDGGGLQKHSVGDTYPWLVVGYGRGEEVIFCIQNLQTGVTLGDISKSGPHHVRQWVEYRLAQNFLSRYLEGSLDQFTFSTGIPDQIKGNPVFSLTGLIINA